MCVCVCVHLCASVCVISLLKIATEFKEEMEGSPEVGHKARVTRCQENVSPARLLLPSSPLENSINQSLLRTGAQGITPLHLYLSKNLFLITIVLRNVWVHCKDVSLPMAPSDWFNKEL